MRTLIFTLAASLCLSVPLAAGQAKKATTKTSATKAKTTAKKPAAKKATAKAKPAPKAPARPQQPSPERYTEIEQALVVHGYLDAADGQWSTASTDALKKFQKDHNLPTDGKLGALTLTAMGLGPRRGAFVVAPQVIGSVVVGVAVE